MSLLDFRSNTYSQNGEDGILNELLRRLGFSDDGIRWCVEFGAWDGKHLSNTFHLVESRNWNAIYIEGDIEKFQNLESTAREHTTIQPILGMVGEAGGSGFTLDYLLSDTALPIDYDLLSIDIDSFDLEVWASHVEYRPSIVIIEINSSVPPGILQWHSRGTPGNSFTSTVNVAARKGYTLVCHTGNLIFVKNELADHVGLDDLDREFPERLFLSSWTQGSATGLAKRWVTRVVSALPKSLRWRLMRLRDWESQN